LWLWILVASWEDSGDITIVISYERAGYGIRDSVGACCVQEAGYA
jgi:hypothetical protein